MTFESLGLAPALLRALAEHGHATPTPIQISAIPLVLEGHDLLAGAQTGTGKTAAFALPLLQKLCVDQTTHNHGKHPRKPRALILTPTRELAAQVHESLRSYGKHLRVHAAAVFGGVGMGGQIMSLRRGIDIIVATPGRLIDHMDRRNVDLSCIEMLVLDEADRMLDMGFIPDIERICKLVPFTRQTLFFCATMPPEITRLTEAFLHNPVRIEVDRAASTATPISQGLVASASGPTKRETLRRLIRGAADFKNAIIFCNRKRDVALLHKSLQKHGFNAGVLHGDMDQRARMVSLDAFKTGNVDLIVCSDVAARGLDIPDVSHVFNFDVPTHAEDYVHRIGRTGRAGKTGIALSIVTPADQKYILEIERLIARKIDWLAGESLANLPGEESGQRTPRGEHSQRSRRTAPGGNARARASTSRPADIGAQLSPKPSPSRRRDGDRPPVEAAPKPAVPQSRHGQNEDGAPVVGMGDHVPRFLLRPTAVKPEKAAGDKGDPR
ncbi:MAG: DEAD/DEAH box helicase [Hyphomicrobiales bacterium]|nr:MAG: DEAD/DEAH box helicase [Hyphomicrobiales bacterium]